MCSTPKAPDAPAPRQAPRAPDDATIRTRVMDDATRRNTMANLILTPGSGLGKAPTAGKMVLGA